MPDQAKAVALMASTVPQERFPDLDAMADAISSRHKSSDLK